MEFIIYGIAIMAIVAGVIGSALTIVAMLVSLSRQQQAAEQKEKGLIENLLRSIQSEITIIWAGYYENVGEKIEKLGEDQPFLIHYPMGKNFFTIYDSNASSIGYLADSELRKMIINTYVTSKCMIDLLHRNNDLLQLYQKAETTETGTADAEKALVTHAKVLKENHANTKQAITELQEKLEKVIDALQVETAGK